MRLHGIYYIISDQSVILYLAYAWNFFLSNNQMVAIQNPQSRTMVNQKAYALVP